jgi:transposase
MPEKFYELARPMLPAEKEIGPQGGRRPTAHRTVLKVIWFVLVTGCRWKDVPQEMGCCGETARTRLQVWERAGIWSQLHHMMLTMLNHKKQLHLETAIIDSAQVRAFGGGDCTGPSPVDRRKKGTKFTLLVDRDGVPLVIHAAPANSSDHREILPAEVDFEPIPRSCTPTRDTTVKTRVSCSAGWALNPTFGIARAITAVTLVAYVGLWNAPSVGSKVSAA